MDQPTYGRVSATITELSIAVAFAERYHGRVLVDDDYNFVITSIMTKVANSHHPLIIVNGAAVGEDFILNLVRRLIAEEAAKASEARQIRCGSYSFAMGCLAFIRRDARLELPPMSRKQREDHTNLWRFDDLIALAERDLAHFQKQEKAA